MSLFFSGKTACSYNSGLYIVIVQTDIGTCFVYETAELIMLDCFSVEFCMDLNLSIRKTYSNFAYRHHDSLK